MGRPRRPSPPLPPPPPPKPTGEGDDTNKIKVDQSGMLTPKN